MARSIFPLSLICLLFAFSAAAHEEVAIRVSGIGNYTMVGLIDPFAGRLIDEGEYAPCNGPDCNRYYALGATLNRIPGTEQLQDVVLWRTFTAPIQYRFSITTATYEPSFQITSQKSFNAAPAMRVAGFPYVNLARLPGAEDPNLIYVARELNQMNVSLRSLRFDEETKSLKMPTKSLITVRDSTLTSVRASDDGDFYGMVTRTGTNSQFVYKESLSATSSKSWKFSETDRITSTSITPEREGQPASRLLLYRVQKQNGNTYSSSVRLQALENSTGVLRSMGTPKNLTPFQATQQAGAEYYQSVAIDPLGRFAVYSVYSAACKKLIVKLQRLNPATGSKIGGPSVLLDCSDFAQFSVGAYALHVYDLTD